MPEIPDHLQTHKGPKGTIYMPTLKGNTRNPGREGTLSLYANPGNPGVLLSLQDHQHTRITLTVDTTTAMQLNEQIATLAAAQVHADDTPDERFHDSFDDLLSAYANGSISKVQLMANAAETLHHFATEYLDLWKDDNVDH